MPNPSTVLYPLTDKCPNCGTGHLEMPGEWGDCRRCDHPLHRPAGLWDKAVRDWQKAQARKARAA